VSISAAKSLPNGQECLGLGSIIPGQGRLSIPSIECKSVETRKVLDDSPQILWGDSATELGRLECFLSWLTRQPFQGIMTSENWRARLHCG
jgi:hypothetical protein